MLKEAVMYRRRADAAFRWGLLLMFVALMLLCRGVAFAQEPGPSPTAPGSVGSQVLNAFCQYALPPLITVVMSLLAFALTKLGTFLHSKAQGSSIGTALVSGADFVMTAVQHVMGGLAPDIKAALANDGRIDDGERTALKAKALALVKAELPDGLKAVLGGLYQGGLDTWLSGKVEQAIDAAASGKVVEGSSTPMPMPAPTPRERP